MATLRLTRRGRLVLVLVVMALATFAGFTIGHSSSLADSGAKPVRHTVIVHNGETLWSVAARVAPHQDPRLVVAQIESLNHLSTPSVEAGQQLVLPANG